MHTVIELLYIVLPMHSVRFFFFNRKKNIIRSINIQTEEKFVLNYIEKASIREA